MSSEGFPPEVVDAIRDSVDCNIHFMASESVVSIGGMYAILAVSTAVFIFLYVALNLLMAKKKIKK